MTPLEIEKLKLWKCKQAGITSQQYGRLCFMRWLYQRGVIYG